MNKKLKTIACLKVIRGGLALFIGGSLLSMSQSSEDLVLNKYPILGGIFSKDLVFQKFVNWPDFFSKQQFLIFGILAVLLGLLRWTEAIGIWFNRRWGQMLSVVTAGIFLLFAMREILMEFSWQLILLILINLVILIYLLFVIYKKNG